MPRYDFRCHACEDTFEVARPFSESASPARCPHGHDDTVKLLSSVAVTGSSPAPGSPPAAAPAPSGGCCGGGCCG